ncbi:dTDP-4-dehydrorhamnose reductase [Aeromonas sp. BIGb0405]|uniref:dTDP-4-dehydrorhamnose reductase n=1 Tax=Aeromonas sp. BIGb0405 TaxID=2940592 RepID=UPI002169BAC0|nr:dTDP-4-dehydrorhamnose reductase [Aeromonas sp. BIGb0405]MCS3455411.1 dTDP-4-dehydrorhamnose reductase [Aeromonas sp. BIGb0405]
MNHKPLGSSLPQILLMGSSGQLGQTLHRLMGNEVLVLLERAEADFLKPIRLTNAITRFRPEVIINAVAYTSVEQAEAEPELAFRVNSQAVRVVADAAKRVGALLVHFSTDYVFDGGGDRAWREADLPAPVNIYGQSKWQGEQAIMASGCRHLIFRTSWLHSPYRLNFLKTMLYQGQKSEGLSIVCDQIGAPTSATMLAEVTLHAIEQTLVNPALDGLYHVTAAGETSWYDYARFIFAEAKKRGYERQVSKLNPVPSHLYPVAATRPLNSRLDTAKFRATFGIALPDWREGVRETLGQLIK